MNSLKGSDASPKLASPLEAVAVHATETSDARSDDRSRQQGRLFFLTLLTVSALVIIFLGIFFWGGRAAMIFTIQKFVVNKAFVTLLPQAYSLEEAERVRKRVYNFYEWAGSRGIPDGQVLQASLKMQEIMADEIITEEEVKSLLALIDTLEKGP